MQEHYAKYEPTILELKKKYETAMKEKMLVTLDRDKVAAKVRGQCLCRTQSCASAVQHVVADWIANRHPVFILPDLAPC